MRFLSQPFLRKRVDAITARVFAETIRNEIASLKNLVTDRFEARHSSDTSARFISSASSAPMLVDAAVDCP